MSRAYITTRRPIHARRQVPSRCTADVFKSRPHRDEQSTRIAAVILGNRVGCLFRELRENSSASLVSAGGANRGNLRGLVRFFLSVYLAHALVHRSICERTGLRHCLAGLSARAFVCVAAYVWLRRDMATAREAKHINCRLTPQKQHDLIPRRICKRLSYTSKFHSKAT